VLSNDSDPNADVLSVVPGSISVPANGSAVLHPDGTVTYTADPSFVGVDTFTYTITDGTATATATVTVTVTAVPASVPTTTPGATPTTTIATTPTTTTPGQVTTTVAPGGKLPATGSGATLSLIVALVLALGGVTLMVASRRRPGDSLAL